MIAATRGRPAERDAVPGRPPAGERGADVIAVDGLGRRIMLRAKHFRGGNGSVGRPVVRHLHGGATADHRATLPIAVTSGRFTGGATAWAAERDRVRLAGREVLRRRAQEDVPFRTSSPRPTDPPGGGGGTPPAPPPGAPGPGPVIGRDQVTNTPPPHPAPPRGG
ncbi:restriction endonuclease, partial [Streptomyces roseolus]|uniref:restriction endonuclease n=1 Tax=Streptomyces roseolus TaxID=67358 RepID=UPI00365CEEA6